MHNPPIVRADGAPARPDDVEIQRLRDLALVDDLTGLANRRAFVDRVHEVFAAARAGGPLFSLILLDLDGLKDINDTLGYQAGDRALQEFAAALRASVRATDLPARFGGDEFAVVALHASEEEAAALHNRLEQTAAGIISGLVDGSPAALLSASIGCSIWRPATASVQDLFTEAETALITAKSSPRATDTPENVFRPRGRRALGEELRSLLAMARRVTGSSDIDDLLRRTVEQAAQLVNAQAANFAFITPQGTIRSRQTLVDGEWQPAPFEATLGEGIIGRAALLKEPRVFNQIPRELVTRLSIPFAGRIRSVLVVPLRERGDVLVGLLTLFNKRGRRPFLPADVELVQAFTDLTVSLLDTLRAYEAAEAAQTALRQANERLHALTEQAGDAIIRLDPDGRIRDANAMAEQMIGGDAPLEGRSVTDFLADTAPRTLAGLRRALRRGGLLRLTLHLRRAGGDAFPVEATVNTVDGELLCIGRDVSERLRAEAATQQRTAELEARNEFAALLAESDSLEQGVQQILPVITRAAEMDGAVLFLERDGHTMSIAAHYNVPDEVLAVLSPMARTADDPIRIQVQSGLPLVVNDVRDLPPRFRPPHEGIRGFVTLPLFSKGSFHGLLGIGDKAPIDPDRTQLARLQALANQLAVWLENRALLEAARRRERDAMFLLDFGRHLTESSDEAAMFAQVVRHLSDYTGLTAIVTLLKPEQRRWQIVAQSSQPPARARHLEELVATWPVAPDDPAWRRTVRHSRRIRNRARAAGDSLPEHVHRYRLRTPLLVDDQVVGSLNLVSFHGDPRIEDRHLALARQAAQHISVALAKTRAYAEAERHRAFLQAVMDHAAEAIIIAGEDGRGVLDLNAAAEKLLGVPRERLLGTSMINLLAEEDRAAAERVAVAMKDRLGPQRRIPVRLLRGDGSILPAEVSASRIVLPSGAVFALLLRDRTPDLEAAREREGLLQEARDEALRATVLLDLAEHLTMVDSEVEIQRTALAACARLAPIGRAALLLWDDAAGRFRAGQMLGATAEEAEVLHRLSLDPAQKPHFAAIMRSDRVIVLEPNAGLPLPDDSLRRLLHARTVAMVPLRAGARFEGVLLIDTKDAATTFSPRDLAILAGVARQTAIALDAAGQRRHAEEARAYLDTVVQNAGDGVFVVDLAELRPVDINEQLTSMLAYTRAEALAMTSLDFVAPQARAQVKAAFALIDRGPVRLEAPLIQRSGGSILTEIRGRMVLLGDRRLAVCTVRDLRHRAETERRLRFQADLLAGVRDAVVAIDLTSTVTYWNAAAESITGWTAAEMIGAHPHRILRPEDQPIIQSQLLHLGQTPGALDTLELVHKDGHPVWVQFSVAPLRDPAGDLTGFALVARDITAQRAADQRLRMFAQMTTGAGEAISLLSLDGVFQYANPAAHALFGYEPETLQGQRVEGVIDREHSILSFEDVARAALADKWQGNLRLRRADGRPIVVRAVVSVLPDSQGRPIGLIASGVDVTAEDAAQREQEQLLESLVAANQRANERTEELRAVADIGRIIVTGGERDDVFQNLARRILAAAAFDAVSISLYDAERDELLFRAVDHRLPSPPHGMLARIGKRASVSHSQVIPTVRRTLQPLVIHEPAQHATLPALTIRALSSDGFHLGVFAPLIFNSTLVGMLGLYALADRAVGVDELRLLSAMADQVAAAVDNLRGVTRMYDMRRDAIFRLALACEARDPETGAHLRQIQSLTEALARELGLPAPEVEELGLASVLHDIGKIAVPDVILTKPGRLTPDEYDIVRLHAGRGEEMLTGPDFYQTARRIARHHHERWDGTGYPDGLTGLLIPRDARIVAVADVYDALISPRVYKPAWPVEDAAREIIRCAGTHFDPTVVAAFESLWRSDRLPLPTTPPLTDRAAS